MIGYTKTLSGSVLVTEGVTNEYNYNVDELFDFFTEEEVKYIVSNWELDDYNPDFVTYILFSKTKNISLNNKIKKIYESEKSDLNSIFSHVVKQGDELIVKFTFVTDTLSYDIHCDDLGVSYDHKNIDFTNYLWSSERLEKSLKRFLENESNIKELNKVRKDLIFTQKSEYFDGKNLGKYLLVYTNNELKLVQIINIVNSLQEKDAVKTTVRATDGVISYLIEEKNVVSEELFNKVIN